MKDIIVAKLTSRKLWLSIACFISMLMAYRGADADSAEGITSLIMAAATVIAYVLGEGMVDSEHADSAEDPDSTEYEENEQQ